MTKEETKARNMKRYAVYSQYRDKRGYTDYYISKNLHVPTSTLSDWKHGISCPKADTLFRICTFLEMPMGELLDSKHEQTERT